MALIVEDGSGLTNANSYATVAEADAYLDARGKLDAWDAYDDDEKAGFLIRAADYMTQTYRMLWEGYRRKIDQALDWPRYDVPKVDAPFAAYLAYYPIDVVPQEVKNAQIESALRLTTAEMAPDLATQAIEVTVGPITKKYAQGSPQQTRFQQIDGILMPLLKGGGTTMGRVSRS